MSCLGEYFRRTFAERNRFLGWIGFEIDDVVEIEFRDCAKRAADF